MAKSLSLQTQYGPLEKLKYMSWGLILLIVMISSVGFAALYSAGGGSMDPWASRQITRFIIGMVALFVIALTDIRFWFNMAWPIYMAGLGLLLVVEIMGHVGMGAQRWIDLGFMKLQPSELMKIAVVLALAKYFHTATLYDMRRITFLIIPAIIIIAPVALVMLQPDLGTSLMIIMAGTAMIFMAGGSIWLFVLGGLAVAAAIPTAWYFLLHDYQKKRVLTFFDPESDPLGAGFHITQSKIALGSGGWDGKGFLQGSQSRLNFLPEKQTDFIFTLWAEEWGFIGSAAVLILFALVFIYGLFIAIRMRHGFGRYLCLGLSVNFSLYVFINISMVMGLIPVVGAPLPLVSYGGTAMLAALIGFGLIMSANIHKDEKLSSL